MRKRNKQKIEREGKKMNENAKTVDTVRESAHYTLLIESAVLFNSLTHTHTHTISLEKIKIKMIIKIAKLNL